ncbi:hypothetical protein TIFTF001_011957 [Ficus carica]|uniref:O-methyltransferase C-terminal domain-containing protein n=1 Tax=Ficus carica TaxID=3494 RepID=A0AA87ZY55_FICCA|nr:hypothetical protein TIFTF001_011957 [Ficus carica]
MSSSLDLEITNTISLADLDDNHGKEEADQEEDEEEDPQESFSYRLYSLGLCPSTLSLMKMAFHSAPWCHCYKTVFMESWYELKDAILEGGIAFNGAHGTHAFEYPLLDSRFNKLFNEAMLNQSTILIKNILEFYKGFGNLQQLVFAVEAVLPVKPGTSYVMKKAFQVDVLMMTQNPGGKSELNKTSNSWQLVLDLVASDLSVAFVNLWAMEFFK